jgi:prepilin-type N-terminal cleavage/methylation domain-containing protein
MNRPHSHRPTAGFPTARPGFSLLELVVAATVATLLLGVALVNATRAISQNNVLRASQRLQTDVQQAFALAGRNRKPVVLRWSSSALEMQVTDAAQTTVYRRSGVGTRAGLGLTAADVTVFPTSLMVFPNGLAADTMYIRLSRNGFTRIVRVSRGGTVRLQ